MGKVIGVECMKGGVFSFLFWFLQRALNSASEVDLILILPSPVFLTLSLTTNLLPDQSQNLKFGEISTFKLQIPEFLLYFCSLKMTFS